MLVGSEWERYLRVAQVVGASPLQPWTLRQFSPRQWKRLAPADTTLPWSSSASVGRCFGRVSAAVLGPRAQMIYNSGFPFGQNDGAIWAGRGVTLALDGGVTTFMGPATITIDPIAFIAQNVNFTLRPTGRTGDRVYADWRNPDNIDLPQRFGASPYAGVDLGQSEVRVDVMNIGVGLSTANQFWGPATDHPIILGNNAAGLPRLFAGTSSPFRLGRLGAAHGQLFWGKADETPYSPLAHSGKSRLVSGIIGVFEPGFMPGLEIGGARFFHVLQDRFSLDRTEFLRPFSSLLKLNVRSQQAVIAHGDNQLASLFMRFVAPQDGMEFYGEYGREDHANTFRELIQLTDHDAAYLVGARKAWRRQSAIVSLRAEVLNSRMTQIALSSQQSPWYVHASVLEGHTQRGQVLGSVGAHGGGASIVALDRYVRRGRWTFAWERVVMGEIASTHNPPDVFTDDVAHAWRVNALRFTRFGNIEGGFAAIYEINRQNRGDAYALQATLSISPRTRQ